MRRVFRVLGYVTGGLTALLMVVTLVVHVWSEKILRQSYVATPEPLPTAPPALVAQGHRLARLHGCLSCHGEGLTGHHVFEAWVVGDVIAPNLTKVARHRTDEQLAVAIRQGIAQDGRGLLVMASAVHARMLPEETAALIAWIRTLPVKDGLDQPFKLRPLGRLMLLLGDFPIQPQAVKEYAKRMPPDLGPAHVQGRRLAASICAECHGPDLNGGPKPFADFNPSFGQPGSLPPNLDVAGAYNLEQFRRLMRTGIPISGRNLGIMTSVAKDDLSQSTDAEIDALHGYLVARAKRGSS